MDGLDALDEHEELDDFREVVVSDGEFQQRCLELIDEILEHNCDIVVTRDDRPVARLMTYWPGRPAGSGKGLFTITGDIVSPMPSEWFGGDKDLFTTADDIVSPMPAEWFDEADSDPVKSP